VKKAIFVILFAQLFWCKSLHAIDTYNPSNNQLTIPSLSVYPRTYNNVVVTVGEVLSIGGGAPIRDYDYYEPTRNELFVHAVLVEGITYTNVVITLGEIVSIAPEGLPQTNLTAAALLNGTTLLKWSSLYANSCKISGSYIGEVPLVGVRIVVAPQNDSQTYKLECIGNGGASESSATASPPMSFEKNCNMSSGGWENSFWYGSVLSSNSTWREAVASSPNPKHCISGSFEADGTIKTISEWSFDYTDGIKTNQGFFYGLWPAPDTVLPPKSTTKDMPILVSNISNSFGVSYTNEVTDVSAGSAYDLLLGLYFSDTRSGLVQTLELGILPICERACYGLTKDKLTVDGVTYDIQTGETGVGPGKYLFFVNPKSPITAKTISFKPFIEYALANGYLLKTSYLNSVSVSNEVFSGTAVSRITAKINK
jgi:hypothetical protein